MSASVAYLIPAKGLEAVNDNLKRDDDPILLILGELKATVKAVSDGLDDMRQEVRNDITEIKTDAKEERNNSSESRRRLHEKFEAVQHGLQQVTSGVNILGKVVDKHSKDIEALTTETTAQRKTVERISTVLRNWSLRYGTITGIFVFIGGALWYAITNYGVIVWRWADQFIPKG